LMPFSGARKFHHWISALDKMQRRAQVFRGPFDLHDIASRKPIDEEARFPKFRSQEAPSGPLRHSLRSIDGAGYEDMTGA
jgi:hypothetical protein